MAPELSDMYVYPKIKNEKEMLLSDIPFSTIVLVQS